MGDDAVPSCLLRAIHALIGQFDKLTPDHKLVGTELHDTDAGRHRGTVRARSESAEAQSF